MVQPARLAVGGMSEVMGLVVSATAGRIAGCLAGRVEAEGGEGGGVRESRPSEMWHFCNSPYFELPNANYTFWH